MSCHESLMARRRKKSKAANNARLKREENSSMLVDKSLPALPPSASVPGSFPNDRKSLELPENDAPTELSPRPHQSLWRNDSSPVSSRRPRELSTEPASVEEFNPNELKLQSKTYRRNRHSAISQDSELNIVANDEGFFIPLTLDPVTALEALQPASPTSSRIISDSKLDRDYFTLSRSPSKTQNGLEKLTQGSASSTPHALLQERCRDPSTEEKNSMIDSIWKAQSGSNKTPPKAASISDDAQSLQHSRSSDASMRFQTQYTRGHTFTLSEPPKSNNLASNSEKTFELDGRGVVSSALPLDDAPSTILSRPSYTTQPDLLRSISSGDKHTPRSAIDNRGEDGLETWSSSLDLIVPGILDTKLETERGVSEAATSKLKKDIPTVKSSNNNSNNNISLMNTSPGISTSPSSSSSGSPKFTLTGSNKLKSETSATAASATSTVDDCSTHLRPSARPAKLQHQLTSSYLSPRPPPLPPQSTSVMAATSTLVKEINGSLPSPQGLPRWSQSEGDFTMDEDFARILGGDSGDQSQSLLRRVSNAVRHGKNASDAMVIPRPTGHGRSASETTNRTINSARWTKQTKLDEVEALPLELSSNPAPLEMQEEISNLRRQLHNSEKRVTELEHQFSAEKDFKNLSIKVQEKRKTVSTLESQTDIMFQQIEVLGKYIERIKDSDKGQDIEEIENSAIDDFVRRLDGIKQKLSESIEALYEERNEILEEKIQLMAYRDRALLEFEQLSSKNAQLADMNNDLTHQIQERLKSQSGSSDSPRVPMNGLGIYAHPSKNKSSLSVQLDDISLRPSTSTTLFSMASPYPSNIEADASLDPSAVLSAPHLINIRKGQATKKTFNWKKGRQTVAKGVSKGIKGAFSSNQQLQTALPIQDQSKWSSPNNDGIGLPYNMTATGADFTTTPSLATVSGSIQAQGMPRNASNDQKNQGGFGLFKKSATIPKSSSTSTALASEKPSTLFGSELGERADHERRQIPNVVTRCIEEVELRGMNVEGIYRKTGGNSQVKMIQEGFEKSEDYDISDPSLDITAVTSVLKQYLRKLPTPLLTFDVYDRILDSSCKLIKP